MLAQRNASSRVLSTVSSRLAAQESGLFYGVGQYLTDLRMVMPSLRSGYLQVRFPRAICTQYSLASLDRQETEVTATFAARSPLGTAVSSHVTTKPYVVERLSAFS